MNEDQNKINRLHEKLDILLKRQEVFQKEISEVQSEIEKLKKSQYFDTPKKDEVKKTEISSTEAVIEPKKEAIITEHQIQYQKPVETPVKKSPVPAFSKPAETKSNLEKFIGENLINKIGIAVLIIGVAIGAKYAIDHRLISPLTRIILGYMVGIGLLGFAIGLKKQYENFSAVLLSGSMAIMYFITYAAYSFYDLYPQAFAFILMVLFTAFTVLAALNYNRQIIAHIGLVGAYAVPFLLNVGSSRIAILLSYMAIINTGILVIAIRKYWKSLYYSAFGLSWLIYFIWYVSKFEITRHFELSLTFLSIFFLIFYLTFLSYKLIKKEKFEISDVLMLLVNSFIFYGIGYSILSQHKTGEQLVGFFTLANAIIHFIVSVIIYRNKLADRNVFYLVSGLVLVFITITIPVQLDGNWVTILWACEAALLFWIGRANNVKFYEILSYPLMFLALISIIQDWFTLYGNYIPENPETKITPILNINFLTSILFIASFVFINIINRNRKYSSAPNTNNALTSIMNFSIPAILIFVSYYSFKMEIATYWNQLFIDSGIQVKQDIADNYTYLQNDYDLKTFKRIWLINYSLVFLTVLAFLNTVKLKNKPLGLINLSLSTLTIIIFLFWGLLALSDLRDSYISQNLSEYYKRGFFHLGIRYVSFAIAGLTIFSCYKYIKQKFLNIDLGVAFDFLLYISLLWIISCELIHWLDITGYSESYKLSLSILWGIYALFMIVIGIWKRKKHLRIGAIVLFSATLLKLFFYDISHLETIQKTIVFVSLGILMLIISFLYNKYKRHIYNENED
jgi:uncharacterized membrane protein